MVVPNKKVAVIGAAGYVGSAVAYCATCMSLPVELVLVDIRDERVMGQSLDLEDAAPESRTKVRVGTCADAGQCDVVIISAGGGQIVGEDRVAALASNVKTFKSIISAMHPIRPTQKMIIITNPVDVMTHLAQKLSGLPTNQVLGSGTVLDSNRLRAELSKILDIHPNVINAYMLGEHGDRQFVGWSTATIGGARLLSHPNMKDVDLDVVEHATRRRGYNILIAKDATHFGVGRATCAILESILDNQSRIYPACVYNEKYGVYCSWPAVIGSNGSHQVLDVPLDEGEQVKMDAAVAAISTLCKDAERIARQD